MILLGTLALGFTAVAAPLAVHLIHRRRISRLDWGAMRFLVELLKRQRRRMWMNQWLLLLLRMLLLAAVVLVLNRPALDPVSAGTAIVRPAERVAAVLLIDDSLSTGVRGVDGQTALYQMKALGQAYLDGLRPGDEVSLVRASRLGLPVDDPLYDLVAARATLAAIEPSGVATDIPALLEVGLAQLARHVNPAAEIVVLTDRADDGWNEAARVRWAEIRTRLGVDDQAAVLGLRARPRVVVLVPPAGPRAENMAVSGLRVDRALLGIRRAVGVQVVVTHSGRRAPGPQVVRLSLDKQVVEEKTIEVPLGGSVEIPFMVSFETAGSHVLEAELAGGRDGLRADDRRALAVEVAEHMEVLLVEGRPGKNLTGSLAFAALALDPAGDGNGLYRLERIAASDLASARLDHVRVVVLGDVQVLEPAAVAALERFIVAGGGCLVAVGPQTDVELANRSWARGGDGFLPCPFTNGEAGNGGAIAANADPNAAPATPVAESVSHPALAPFKGEAGEAWRAAKVRSWLRLDAAGLPPGELSTLLRLDSGDPLLVERRRGQGRVCLLTTSLDLSWTELPTQPAFVPLLRSLIASLGSTVMPPRSIGTGTKLSYLPRGPQAVSEAPMLECPDETELPLERSAWEGLLSWSSQPLAHPGIYRVRDGEVRTWVAVATPISESVFDVDGAAARERAESGLGAHQFSDVPAVQSAFDPAARTAVELWRWVLALAIGLLFAESFYTRRQSTQEVGRRDVNMVGVAAPASAPAPAPASAPLKAEPRMEPS